MIQRIQTLYLFLACVLCVGCMSTSIGCFYTQDSERVADLYNLWLVSADSDHSFYPWSLFALLLICATICFLAIFLFTRRAFQMRVTSFCILLLLGWYVTYAGIAYMISNSMEVSFRPNWTAAFPAVGVILLVMAFRGIMKDEKLVRSLDRLR